MTSPPVYSPSTDLGREMEVGGQDPYQDIDEEKQDEKVQSSSSDVFGDEEHAEVKYKVLSWWQCGFLMVAETVSIGILSLPAVVAELGLVPAIVLLIGLGLMATYTGYTIGQFRWRYPHIQNMADAGEVLMGRFGRELFGIGQLLLVVFIMASHLLTFTVAMNTITDHGTCSIVFGVVGMVISYILCIPRTSANVSYLSIACAITTSSLSVSVLTKSTAFLSVFSTVLIVMIAVGVSHPWQGSLQATVDTSLYKAFLAVCNIVFSFCGHVAFFGFIAELKDPYEYPKSLLLLQGTDVTLYTVTAVVIYCFAGQDVTSPALGSASPVVAKVAYGIALPTILIGGVVNGHVAAKYVYVRIFRHGDRMHKKDLVATGSWLLIGLVLWVAAWVIAEAIPVFNNLLSLIASLFASWFTCIFPPLHLSWSIANSCICGLGLYVSGKALHDNPSSASFSCANNA
ncbi:conserved hypothetical protein [Aspergillus terreus NIH2624]|uniref:Amino acid transporter transmembrane domain-containing protein n=1 Tax=Aspergillus terreus (strain NIH 2624 / FGSC A1156) TaxID=341663 RepID=Q0CEG6_ASPTN|nr:uncharacterized protein ATEG_07918 [Aspergillus terreus NIH2624]EAU32180.1 conserved hypothetical protein [Aspergillus terreus NIH2624]